MENFGFTLTRSIQTRNANHLTIVVRTFLKESDETDNIIGSNSNTRVQTIPSPKIRDPNVREKYLLVTCEDFFFFLDPFPHIFCTSKKPFKVEENGVAALSARLFKSVKPRGTRLTGRKDKTVLIVLIFSIFERRGPPPNLRKFYMCEFKCISAYFSRMHSQFLDTCSIFGEDLEGRRLRRL